LHWNSRAVIRRSVKSSHERSGSRSQPVRCEDDHVHRSVKIVLLSFPHFVWNNPLHRVSNDLDSICPPGAMAPAMVKNKKKEKGTEDKKKKGRRSSKEQRQ